VKVILCGRACGERRSQPLPLRQCPAPEDREKLPQALGDDVSKRSIAVPGHEVYSPVVNLGCVNLKPIQCEFHFYEILRKGSHLLFIKATPLVSFHRTSLFDLSEFGDG
jgi:hypothetical protein